MWFGLRLFLRLRLPFFFFFFFLPEAWTQLPVGPVHYAWDPHHFQRPHIGPAMALSMGPMHYSWDPQISLFSNFSLKMGLTILFTHFKIILLQCFQFSIFSFNKNKLYPNGPLIWKLWRQHNFGFHSKKKSTSLLIFFFVKNLRAFTSVLLNFLSILHQKTYFFYFTHPLLQNTHISLSILHIYSIKYSLFY